MLSQKQVQKGGLAPSVSAGEAQLPVGINLKADIFKNWFMTAVIGKGQIGNLNQRHSALQNKELAAGKLPAANTNRHAPKAQQDLVIEIGAHFPAFGHSKADGPFAVFCKPKKSAGSIAHPFNTNLNYLFKL